MSDFEQLKSLQRELINTLSERKEVVKWFPRTCCKAKVRRLRLQIQEVMLRIEKKMNGYVRWNGKREDWE